MNYDVFCFLNLVKTKQYYHCLIFILIAVEVKQVFQYMNGLHNEGKIILS